VPLLMQDDNRLPSRVRRDAFFSRKLFHRRTEVMRMISLEVLVVLMWRVGHPRLKTTWGAG
jgi:hypothetical protein